MSEPMTNDSSPIVSLSELLPCPFCGGEAIQCGNNAHNPRHWVMCRKCHACPGGDVGSLPEAITAWNTRASRPAEGEVEPVVTAQCCMCGKTGLNTVDGEPGEECQLEDGRWTCSRNCYYTAVDWYSPSSPLASPTRPISPAHGVKADAWRQITAALVKETERMCGPGPMLDAVRSCLTTPADSGSAEVTEGMVFAVMRRADELGEVLDDIDAREILTAALNNGRS